VNQLSLDIHEGRRLKREGSELVASKNALWIDQMLVQLLAFAWARQEFTVELFRAWAGVNHFPEFTASSQRAVRQFIDVHAPYNMAISIYNFVVDRRRTWGKILRIFVS
jgi:hypothetical protein